MDKWISFQTPRMLIRKSEKNTLRRWKLCELVEMRRIELLTPCLQGRCSPSWATPPNPCWYFVKLSSTYSCIVFVRFPCLNKNFFSFILSTVLVFFSLVHMVCLSDCRVYWYANELKLARWAKLVGLSGLEPPTSRLSGVRSNRLSYRPMQGFQWVLISFPLFLLSILICKCSIVSDCTFKNK